MPYGSHGSQWVIVFNGFQWFYITQLIGFRTQVPKHMNVPLEHRRKMRHHSMISLRFPKSLSYLVLIFFVGRFCKFPASGGNQDSLKIGTKWSMYWFFWWLSSIFLVGRKILLEPTLKHLGLSENSVPLHPMVNDHYPYEKWLFHWGYTGIPHFQTYPYELHDLGKSHGDFISSRRHKFEWWDWVTGVTLPLVDYVPLLDCWSTAKT